MYQGLGGLGGGLLGGTNTYSPYSQSSVGSNMTMGTNPAGLLGGGNLFTGGARCTQNEERLFQEKA